jgi:hypothetical protein
MQKETFWISDLAAYKKQRGKSPEENYASREMARISRPSCSFSNYSYNSFQFPSEKLCTSVRIFGNSSPKKFSKATGSYGRDVKNENGEGKG